MSSGVSFQLRRRLEAPASKFVGPRAIQRGEKGCGEREEEGEKNGVLGETRGAVKGEKRWRYREV